MCGAQPRLLQPEAAVQNYGQPHVAPIEIYRYVPLHMTSLATCARLAVMQCGADEVQAVTVESKTLQNWLPARARMEGAANTFRHKKADPPLTGPPISVEHFLLSIM